MIDLITHRPKLSPQNIQRKIPYYLYLESYVLAIVQLIIGILAIYCDFHFF